jgi:hypothetical protein
MSDIGTECQKFSLLRGRYHLFPPHTKTPKFQLLHKISVIYLESAKQYPKYSVSDIIAKDESRL